MAAPPEPDLTPLPVTHETSVPEDYIDMMGHMNVVWYAHLFSNAMGGLMGKIGLNPDFMTRHQMGVFALEGHIRYLAEVRVGERLTLYTRLLPRTEKRFHAIHFMKNADRNRIAATFETIVAAIDMRSRKMAAFPPEVADPIDRLIREHEALGWPPPVCGVMKP